ncbi:hypothetical membrane protein [Pseudomonas knackmussii B13]|uniref:Hypothetical membrane protein n=1 Tax=Pseudomonas knackmussii (strain DSM 6978 / CCUG 54928 / LMG 23759 / B13) TaxID=1301098 RepID=A0A024HFK9_PSEKB|nr:hypothetical protein [Pseudomonas knackmussii]CDF83414.1 hypothetical membrane protein [Pseudomonas knackmussii B13]
MTPGRKKLLIKSLDLLAVCGLGVSLVLIVNGLQTIIFVTSHHWSDWAMHLLEFDGGLLHVGLPFLFGLACLIAREVVARTGPPHDDDLA